MVFKSYTMTKMFSDKMGNKFQSDITGTRPYKHITYNIYNHINNDIEKTVLLFLESCVKKFKRCEVPN